MDGQTGYGGYGNYYSNNSAANNPMLTQKVLRSEDMVESAISALKGLKRVKTKNGWAYEQVYAPKMNQEGIRLFEARLQSILNRNTFLSALSNSEEADSLLNELVDNFTMEIIYSRNVLEIKDEDIDFIIDTFLNYTQMALYRPVTNLASDKDLLGKSVVETYNTNTLQDQTQKQGGFLGRLFDANKK